MKVLFIGDIVGRAGRKITGSLVPLIIEREKIDLTVANGENAAGGVGITADIAHQIFSAGVAFITLVNHTWQRKEVLDIIDNPNIVRPANYPPGVPGKGYAVHRIDDRTSIAIINLLGRVYMSTVDCPFRSADAMIEKLRAQGIRNIIVDFHAEITSEKTALGWYLDGKVSAVLGTHTHVQTADERILPGGSAYITDVGMTGSRDSIIGVKKEIVLKRYLTQMPMEFEVAMDDLFLSGVIVDIDEASGKARDIKRIFEPYAESGGR